MPSTGEKIHVLTAYCKRCKKAVIIDLTPSIRRVKTIRPGRIKVIVDAMCPDCGRVIYSKWHDGFYMRQ